MDVKATSQFSEFNRPKNRNTLHAGWEVLTRSIHLARGLDTAQKTRKNTSFKGARPLLIIGLVLGCSELTSIG